MIKKLIRFCIPALLISNFLSAQTATLQTTLSFKELNDVKIPYQNGFPLPSFEKQNRQMIDLKGVWKKQRFSASENITLAKRDDAGYAALISEAENRYEFSFDDSGWEDKNIPSVENEIYPFPKVPEYYEDGVWYRYKFDAADSLNGKFIKLMFYAVNYVADVWINGNYLGWHEGGYTPFAFDVSEVLNYGSENVLAVRVHNPKWGFRNDIVPFTKADWFNYTGIIHDVYLEIAEPVNVVRANIVPLDVNGNIQTTITVLNKNSSQKNIDVEIEIFNADVNSSNINSEKASDLIGTAASVNGNLKTSLTIPADSLNVISTQLQINNPRLWFPKTPELYIMKVSLKENNEIVDEYYTQFGIRTIKTDKSKVLINNKTAFLTGVARHEDHPVYGRSIPIDVIYSDLQKVKDVNANMLRTAHYPNHLQTYLLADRMGIVIVEEIPVWWFDDAAPWQIQKARRVHEQMFREMVFKDFNRPSIMLWSTSNECKDVTNRKEFIENVKADIKANYTDGRLITQSAAADRPGYNDPSQASCDVAGWTMYFGIFHGSEYFLGTNYFLAMANATYPEKPVLDTEFGYWSTENGSSAPVQVRVFGDTWLAFRKRAPINMNGFYDPTGFLMGTTWWCIFDWYSSQHPEGFQSMGLYNMARTESKPVADTLRNTYAMYFNMGGVISAPVNVQSTPEIPSEFSLEQNYPNPFNPKTKIRYAVEKTSNVSLRIFNVLGNELSVLVNEVKSPGFYEVDFDASDLSSGVYYYKLSAGNFSKTMKMILLK